MLSNVSILCTVFSHTTMISGKWVLERVACEIIKLNPEATRDAGNVFSLNDTLSFCQLRYNKAQGFSAIRECAFSRNHSKFFRARTSVIRPGHVCFFRIRDGTLILCCLLRKFRSLALLHVDRLCTRRLQYLIRMRFSLVQILNPHWKHGFTLCSCVCRLLKGSKSRLNDLSSGHSLK